MTWFKINLFLKTYSQNVKIIALKQVIKLPFLERFASLFSLDVKLVNTFQKNTELLNTQHKISPCLSKGLTIDHHGYGSRERCTIDIYLTSALKVANRSCPTFSCFNSRGLYVVESCVCLIYEKQSFGLGAYLVENTISLSYENK
jgi:hypothetical protein